MFGFLRRLRRYLSVVRLEPFETDTPAGRANERYRRAALTTIAAGFAMAVSVGAALISIPLTIGYLGEERFGMWMVISSIAAFLAFTDLGIGNGLLNAISKANGAGDRESARQHASSAFLLLLALATVLAGAFAIAYPLIHWPSIFNVTSATAQAEAGPAVAVFIGCFLARLPLDTVKKIQFGLQEGFRNSLWASLGSILGLLGLLLVIFLEGGLPWLVLGISAGPVIAAVLNSAVFFGIRYRWLIPRIRFFRPDSAKFILQTGSLFVILQAAMAFAFASDNLVVAQLFGAAAVAQYAVAKKLFDLAGSVLMMMLSPLWPAYGEAAARNEVGWVKRTLVRSVVGVALLSLGISGVLIVLGNGIIELWVGPEITVPTTLLLGFGIWTVFSLLGHSLATFMNGINRIGFQAAIAVAMAVAALAGKIILAQLIGLPGVIFGTVAAYLLITLIPAGIYTRRLIRDLEAQAASRPGQHPTNSAMRLIQTGEAQA